MVLQGCLLCLYLMGLVVQQKITAKLIVPFPAINSDARKRDLCIPASLLQMQLFTELCVPPGVRMLLGKSVGS